MEFLLCPCAGQLVLCEQTEHQLETGEPIAGALSGQLRGSCKQGFDMAVGAQGTFLLLVCSRHSAAPGSGAAFRPGGPLAAKTLAALLDLLLALDATLVSRTLGDIVTSRGGTHTAADHRLRQRSAFPVSLSVCPCSISPSQELRLT